MKIILLPGLDGTGSLFSPLLPLLFAPADIIAFPSAHTYQAIYTHVKSKLPNEDFYIVAESFSGPVAARLAAENLSHFKGVIFVATFLTCPSPSLVAFAKNLPLKTLLKLPFADYFIRKFLIGPKFPVALFRSVISNISSKDIKSRLIALQNLDKTQPRSIRI